MTSTWGGTLGIEPPLGGISVEAMSVVKSSLRAMIIDCESCALYDPTLLENEACNDCVVSVIISVDSLAASARKVATSGSDETDQAIALLSSRGMVPPMRFLPVNFG